MWLISSHPLFFAGNPGLQTGRDCDPRPGGAKRRRSLLAARDCADHALEAGPRDGIRHERRVFHALFATEDQKEGMGAFLEKRAPRSTGR